MARSDLSAADGVVDQVQESSVDLDPPPRPLLQRKLRDIFLDVASAPPGQEGRSLARGCVKYIDALDRRGGASKEGAPGSSCSRHSLDQPPRLRRIRMLCNFLLDRASTPPVQEGRWAASDLKGDHPQQSLCNSQHRSLDII